MIAFYKNYVEPILLKLRENDTYGRFVYANAIVYEDSQTSGYRISIRNSMKDKGVCHIIIFEGNRPNINSDATFITSDFVFKVVEDRKSETILNNIKSSSGGFYFGEHIFYTPDYIAKTLINVILPSFNFKSSCSLLSDAIKDSHSQIRKLSTLLKSEKLRCTD